MNTIEHQFNLTGWVTIANQMPEFMGNYSYVFRGDLHGMTVAIKVIKGTGNPNDTKRKVLRERIVWSAISHPNILPFFGYADDPIFGPFGALVSPWYTRGDAGRFLRENGKSMILAERTNLWKGIIAGVAYLHGHSPIIIHGDLKPGNVLIDETGRPRLCDFGLARIFLEEESTGLTTISEHTGTTRYLAPELVAGENSVHPTTASDVYALGCLGLEIVFLQKPYANRANNIRGKIVSDIKAGVSPASIVPSKKWPSNRIWSLIVDLWHSDPRFRPRASMVALTLARTEFTLPLPALRKIIEFTANSCSGTFWISEWIKRTGTLRNLSLVSRACWLITNPILYRDIGYGRDRFEKFIYALNNSCIRPLSINTSVLDGYGSHIRTIVMEHSIDLHDPATFYQKFRALLERSPSLQIVSIYDALGSFQQQAAAHSPTTMEFDSISISWIARYISVFQEFLFLQQLIIRDCALDTTSVPTIEPILLPHLTGISVETDRIDRDQSLLLNSFCTWSMPRLQSFTYSKPSLSEAERIPMLRFFGIHGHGLQYLSATIDDFILLSAFKDCDNLLSAHFSSCTLDTICHLPMHPTLERIELCIDDTFRRFNYIDIIAWNSSRLKDIRQIKANASTNLPNLTNARFYFVPVYEPTPQVYHPLSSEDLVAVTFSAREDNLTTLYRSGKSESYLVS